MLTWQSLSSFNTRMCRRLLNLWTPARHVKYKVNQKIVCKPNTQLGAPDSTTLVVIHYGRSSNTGVDPTGIE